MFGKMLCIYLDQNKWIELVKGIKNKEKKYVDLLNHIKQKVNDKEWVLPLSITHAIETSKRDKEISRKELTELMSQLSAGYSLPPYTEIEKIELDKAIDISINSSSRIKPDEIISKNVGNILGMKMEISGLVLSEDEENNLAEFMKENYFSVLVESARGLDDDQKVDGKEFADDINKMRQEYYKLYKEHTIKDKAKMKNSFLAREFGGKIIANPEYTNLLTKLKAAKITFDSPETTWAFMKNIPTFYVQIVLAFEYIKNHNLVVKDHDFHDITFLQIAIPYSDVVIGEKHWISVSKANKLDVEYKTKLETDLFYLLDT